ncbi:hypothetical protein ACTFIT_001613 [Dictyostelium discoideum]
MNKDNNNNKCSFHPNKNLELLCFNCKFIPCCMHCISQHGEHHGHKTNCIDSIETSNILKMMNLFKNDIIPKLKEIVENDKQIINKSENIYNEINQQYENNKILVTNEFKKFHTLIQINQLDIENQLRTTFDENTIIYTIINSSINNNNNYNINDDNNYGINIESIGNKLDNLNDTHLQYCNENQIYNWLENQDIYQLFKKYQQSTLIVNNKNNIENLNKLKEYNNQSIVFKIMNEIKNNLKLIY